MIQTRPSARRTRSRRALVVYACGARAEDCAAQALLKSLRAMGIQTVHLEVDAGAAEIADEVVAVTADSIELCIGDRGSAVLLLRALLRELIKLNRREVSIVVHKVGRHRI